MSSVETTPVTQTIVGFYEIAHFLSKTTSFYKKQPPFYKRLQITSLEKTPTSHISLYKKTQFLEIIETPDWLRLVFSWPKCPSPIKAEIAWIYEGRRSIRYIWQIDQLVRFVLKHNIHQPFEGQITLHWGESNCGILWYNCICNTHPHISEWVTVSDFHSALPPLVSGILLHDDETGPKCFLCWPVLLICLSFASFENQPCVVKKNLIFSKDYKSIMNCV